MATTAKNIDISGLIALANEIKKLDDEGVKRSAENIFNIAKSFESFQNLKISKLEKTISGVKDYAEKINESLLLLKVPDSIKNIGEEFGKPLLKISEGLKSFSRLSVKGIKTSFDTTSIQLFELTKTFSDTLLFQTGKDFTYLQNNFGKPLEEISEGLKAFSNLTIIKVKSNLDRIGSAFKDIIEEFGIYFSSEVNPIFTQLAYTFGEPLLKISEALKSFSDLSMSEVRGNLTALGSSFKNIVEEFGTYFSGVTTDDFKKLGESFGEPLTKISKGLKDFSELSINELKNNFDKLTDFTAIIKDFNALNSAAGSGIGDSLLSLFEGLERFSKLNILKLKLNIVLLGILPGSIKKLAKTFSDIGPDLKDAGENFGEPLEKIANGLTIFSELNVGSIFKNIILLSVLPLNSFFKRLAKSVPDIEEAGESFGKPLLKISEGLKTFSELNVMKLIFNALSLNVFAKLLSSAIKTINGIGKVNEINSIADMILKFGNIFKQLSETIATAIVSFFKILGKNLVNIVKGTLAIGILSVALGVFATGLKQFSNVNWKDVIAGAAALGILTAAVYGLGLLVSGPQGLLFAAGLLALTGLGVSLLPAAFAFKMLGEGASALANGLSQIISLLPELDKLNVIGDGMEKTATSLDRINSNRSSTGQDLEGMKYDNQNRRSLLNGDNGAGGANVVGGSTINTVGGSTINNTNINQNNIPDRTTYVLSGNMAWTAC